MGNWKRLGSHRYPYEKYFREYEYYYHGEHCKGVLDISSLSCVLRLSLKDNDSIFYPGGHVAREHHDLLYMKNAG